MQAFVGTFNENDLKEGKDKKAVAEMKQRFELLSSGLLWDNFQENLYRENNQGVLELHPEFMVVSTNSQGDEFIEYEGSDLQEARKHKGEIRTNFTWSGWDVIV